MKKDRHIATNLLILINILVFVYMVYKFKLNILNMYNNFSNIDLFKSGALFAPAIIYNRQYWRLLTAMFIHVNLMHIAGLLNLERQKFKELINVSGAKDEGILQTLAYLDIFAQQYEEAYALYNSLIDDYGAKDTKTLFLAAVAAVGANNPNSAIALLQLSKLTDKNNKESKAALGMLYQEVKNYEAAISQYKTLPNNFKSEFFTFDINNN